MITYHKPWGEYLQIKKMNPSTIVAGVRSMKRLKRCIDQGFPEETNAMRMGSGVHALLLEPDEFEDRFVVVPDFHLDADNVTAKGVATDSKLTLYYKAKIAEFAVDNGGKTFLSRKQYDDALYAIESLHSRPAMREIVETSAKEVTIEGSIAGVPFKGRMDLIRNGLITDLKNTNDVDKRAFGRIFARLHYAFKLSIYRELVRQATGEMCEVKIICQETAGDFDNTLVTVPDIILDNALAQVFQVVDRYKEAVRTNCWPGVDGGKDEYELYVPQWAMEDADDLEWGEDETLADEEGVTF